MVKNSQIMKTLHYTLSLGMLAAVLTTASAQTMKLNDLNPFDKIIITGDVAALDVSSSASGHPSILVEGAKIENVSANVQAGTLSLDLSNVNGAVVHVFNHRLKRIQGPAGMEVSGVEFIGNDGNYLVTGHRPRPHETRCDRLIDLDLEKFVQHDFDFDIDIDLDKLEDIDVEVEVDIDEHDWNWEWSWDWNWQDHHDEIRSHTHKWREELHDTMEDVRENLGDDLKELKKELKRLD